MLNGRGQVPHAELGAAYVDLEDRNASRAALNPLRPPPIVRPQNGLTSCLLWLFDPVVQFVRFT